MVASLLIYFAMAGTSIHFGEEIPPSAMMRTVRKIIYALPRWPGMELLSASAALIVPIAIFRGARNHPLVVARLIAWFTVSYFTFLLLVMPFYLSGLAHRFISETGVNVFRTTGFDLAKILFIACVGLALVCLEGEFFQIASERVMEAEWRTAESENAAAAERLRRRQKLIFAVRGRRMPMVGAAARFIALIMLPLCFCWFVAEYEDAMRIFVIEKELPAPPILARASIHYPRRALHVSIASDGGVSFDDHLMVTADETGLGQLANALRGRRPAVDGEHLVLHVASEATCQRLIDLLNLAARLRLPVIIEDVGQ